MPPVLPQTPGTWHKINSHSIQFQPTGFGYGLGANVSIGLPNGVRLVGAKQSGDAWSGWTVPRGTTLRLQQLLAVLGYLPLRFHYDGGGPGPSTAAQLDAAIKPPAGHFSWRYPNTPSALVNMWAPGTFGEMTKGAIMAFEDSNGMTADGVPGPAGLERADHRGRAGQEQHVRLHVRAGQRGQPRERVDVAQRQDRRLRAGQHRVSRRRRPRRACSPCSSTRRR